jgi:AraC-like DNA-binding protein
VDVLEDLLTRSRARGSIFAASILRGPWGLAFGDDGRVSLHPVLAGELWCRVGDQVEHARGGDIVLLRGGQKFELLSAPDGEAAPLEAVLARAGVPAHGRRLELIGEEPPTELLCGAYSFTGSLCEELVEALPEVAVVRTDDPALAGAVELVRTELAADRPGTSMVLDRLLDVLLVGCLRALWAKQLRPPVWAGVPQDAAVGAALRALHTRPEHAWTVAELAREAALSRAALARRFTAEVGAPPLAYLTGWRMRLAREALLEHGGTLASVAQQIGYANEYAFAAAFKREVGQAPGRWRATQQGRARSATTAATAP